MSRKWGRRSTSVLYTLDPCLRKIMDRVLHEVADISLTSGARTPDEQNDLFTRGKTKVKWPDSKHNTIPSKAVDFQPHPYPTYEPKLWGALGYIAGRAIAIANEEGVTLRWGGDWDSDGDTTDQSFDDLFHLEITECEHSH